MEGLHRRSRPRGPPLCRVHQAPAGLAFYQHTLVGRGADTTSAVIARVKRTNQYAASGVMGTASIAVPICTDAAPQPLLSGTEAIRHRDSNIVQIGMGRSRHWLLSARTASDNQDPSEIGDRTRSGLRSAASPHRGRSRSDWCRRPLPDDR